MPAHAITGALGGATRPVTEAMTDGSGLAPESE